MMIPYVQEISTGSSTNKILDSGFDHSMMVLYVQEIRTGSSTTMIPDRGLINDDSLCSGNKYWKLNNHDPGPGFDQ
jgi:hypothetical protein